MAVAGSKISCHVAIGSSEPERPKFVLKSELWSRLEEKLRNDTLLCSTRKDAVKWLTVSKDIKEVIEENWDKIPRFTDYRYNLHLPNGHKIVLFSSDGKEWDRHDSFGSMTMSSFNYIRRAGMRGLELTSLVPSWPKGYTIREWDLSKASPAEIVAFLEKIFDIRKVVITGWLDWDLLNPLVVAGIEGARFRFVDGRVAREEKLEVIKRLRIKVLDLERRVSPEFLNGLKDASLEEINMQDSEPDVFKAVVNKVPVIRNFKVPPKMLRKVLELWYNFGLMPRLREMCGVTWSPSYDDEELSTMRRHIFGILPVQTIHYVPQWHEKDDDDLDSRCFDLPVVLANRDHTHLAQIVLTGYQSGHVRFEFYLLE